MRELKTKHRELIKALRVCKARFAVEDMFVRFGIKSPATKYAALHMAMYNPIVFYEGKSENPEVKYELQLQIFLTGTWRLNKVYDKMGLPGAESLKGIQWLR